MRKRGGGPLMISKEPATITKEEKWENRTDFQGKDESQTDT